MKCKKVPYKTHKDAAAALKIIKGINNVNTRDKKPIRSYLCPNCKHFHLTSVPIKTYKHFHPDPVQQAETPLSKLAEYWEHRLGVKKD